MTLSRMATGMAAGALILSVWGCSKGLPGAVPVNGTVTYNGSPVAGAMVGFIPVNEEGKPANGLTDADGSFQLSTFMGGGIQAKGALPGEYKVTIGKTKIVMGFDPATGKMKQPEASGEGTADPRKPGAAKSAMMGPPEQLLPVKYSNPNKSGFTATVKPSGNEPLKFELTD